MGDPKNDQVGRSEIQFSGYDDEPISTQFIISFIHHRRVRQKTLLQIYLSFPLLYIQEK